MVNCVFKNLYLKSHFLQLQIQTDPKARKLNNMITPVAITNPESYDRLLLKVSENPATKFLILQ
jgi:hypothetical protein